MKPLTVELHWLETVCQGPFSYRKDGEKFTFWQGVTVCAATYLSLMRYAWVSAELLDRI